jgi:hypothetical protein
MSPKLTTVPGTAVSAVCRVELVYVRRGGTDTYAEAVESPIDALINGLSLDGWNEIPMSPLGTEFVRCRPECGAERLIVVNSGNHHA